jgi:hypothetical protein
MAEECNVCESLLDSSNPAYIRCVNVDCTEVLKCHCCEEKIGIEVAHVKCFNCKEIHCQYCEKDSFFYNVKYKERNICLTCKEARDDEEAWIDDAFGPQHTLESYLQDLPCGIELEDGEICEGTLSELTNGWGCLICGREADEGDILELHDEAEYDRYET